MQINLLKQLKKLKNKRKSNKQFESVPKEIRVIFGKFYCYSLVLLVFFITYSFIKKYISFISNIALLVILPILYVLMIIDAFRKCKTFRSVMFYIFIFLNTVAYICGIIKFVYFT